MVATRRTRGGSGGVGKKAATMAATKAATMKATSAKRRRTTAATSTAEGEQRRTTINNPVNNKAPPSELLPSGSDLKEKAAETAFTSISSDDSQTKVQVLELEFEDDKFVGMPFVVLNVGNWIKNSGSDFYIDFKVKPKQDAGDGNGTAKSLLDKIVDLEDETQKSFMHRFNIGADLLGEALDNGEMGLAGILVWIRFMATRQLVWNKNYNVKPREISQAQDRLTNILQDIYQKHSEYQELVRMILSTVGRGGEGDVGQRFRDEILVIQRWNVADLTGLSGEGRKAQDYVCKLAPRIRKLGEIAQARAKEASLVPFSWIFGKELQVQFRGRG